MYGIVHESECPYWDHVSLNNINSNTNPFFPALVPNDPQDPRSVAPSAKLMIYLFTSAGKLLKEIRVRRIFINITVSFYLLWFSRKGEEISCIIMYVHVSLYTKALFMTLSQYFPVEYWHRSPDQTRATYCNVLTCCNSFTYSLSSVLFHCLSIFIGTLCQTLDSLTIYWWWSSSC